MPQQVGQRSYVVQSGGSEPIQPVLHQRQRKLATDSTEATVTGSWIPSI